MMMMNDRHQPRHYQESNRDSCHYCHRTPAVWQQNGNERVCSHCGTRVYSPVMTLSAKPTNKSQR
ncbi:MAG: hypothetical protein J0L63_09225 [Anaerolineae bacterium]|nr:hypothetical protein [Anaerolineae bacterium]MBN8619077.1 hypothetical protein [Anaerolineae bacterium]